MAKASQKRKDAILDALGRGATIGKAAEAGGISRMGLHRWRKADPAFDAAVTEVLEMLQMDKAAAAQIVHLQLLESGYWPAVKYQLDLAAGPASALDLNALANYLRHPQLEVEIDRTYPKYEG